jgi:hypothetical protein
LAECKQFYDERPAQGVLFYAPRTVVILSAMENNRFQRLAASATLILFGLVTLTYLTWQSMNVPLVAVIVFCAGGMMTGAGILLPFKQAIVGTVLGLVGAVGWVIYLAQTLSSITC